MKKKTLIIGILLLVITLGITYAWWNWTSSNTNVTFTIEGATITYNAGNNISGIKLIPVSTKEKGVTDNTAAYKEITASANTTMYLTLNLELTTFPSALADQSLVWEIYKGTTKIGNGNFSNKAQEDTISLFTNQEINSTQSLYKLYIWIDGNQDNPSAMMNQNFVFTLNATATDEVPNLDTSGANTPDLIDGLIPVSYKGEACSEIDNPSYESYVDCFDENYNYYNLSNDELAKLEDYCVSEGMTSEEQCPSLIENVLSDENNEEDKFEFLYSFVEDYKTMVKADSRNNKVNNQWYDYNQKKWANAVLVTSSTRNKYQSAAAGTAISEDDVLAHYVWIPRYKYKVWNINKVIGVDSYNAQTTGIDIVFESEGQSTGTISCNYNFAITNGTLSETCTGSNGDYYTHPAFLFGNYHVRGIWIGKFEVSSEDSTITDGGGESTNLTVRIKPNVISWRGNSATNFYKVIYDMQKENNIYGLDTSRSNIDSHMLKNIEWGAVAYLSHSNYGRCSNNTCEEITWNNNFYYYTGSYRYTSSTNSSTTNNVYGIYDMSGGAYEYVMGNTSYYNGRYTYYSSSGGTNYTYSNETSMYIDTYAKGSTYNDQTAYNRSRLGDATGEIVNWGDNSKVVPHDTVPWFIRGGYIYAGGILSFSESNGSVSNTKSSRATLISVFNAPLIAVENPLTPMQ